jgi:insulysin
MRPIGLVSLLASAVLAVAPASAQQADVSTRTFQLENGIQVLIETDPGLDRSAAALSVNVGSMDNGGVDGLAHFLEHMLFLGTEKYPDPADYKNYLAQSDGTSNAYTAESETNYHFQVPNDAFEGALDRFSRFFIDPLMTDALSTREVNAVDSEHSKNLENEFWRARQVWRSLLNPANPNSGFSTGNSKTLAGVKNSELRAFYEEKYSSNLMHLAIVSPFPADQVEAWVRAKFADVPNLHREALSVDVPLQGEALRGKLVEVKALTDVHQMWIRFELPESAFDWRSKPSGILGGILGHEGNESLLQNLKKDGLATGLSAGAQRLGRQGFFNLTLTLTPEGMAKLDTVLERVFGMINYLRALPEIPQYLFDERQGMSEISFRYRERSDAMAEARLRASLMELYPYDNLLPSVYLVPEPSQESVREVLDKLTPDNAVVLVYANDRETDQVEPFYQTDFRVSPFGDELMAKLKAALPAEGVTVPPPNPFIPSNFDLVETVHAEIPWKLDAPYGEVWLRHDTLFLQPKAALEVVFYNDKNSASARDFVLGNLYSGAVQLAMNPYSYPLNEAGVNLGISSERRGITLVAGGFSDKMPALAGFVVPFMTELRIDEAQFDVIKEQYAMGLANFPKAPPTDQAFEKFRELIREVHFTPAQQADALSALTYADLNDYFGRVYDAVRVRAFVYGNMTEASVKATVDDLVAGVAPTRIIPEEERYTSRVIEFAKGKDSIVRESIDAQDSVALMLVEGEPGTREELAALNILTKIYPTGFYGDLRTLQQTGYIVQAFGFDIEGLPLMFGLAQSSVVPTDSLRGRFIANLANFLEDLDELSDDEFAANRDAAVAGLSQKSTTFAEELARNTALAYTFHGDFRNREKDIAAVRALTRERWIELTRKYLGSDARTVFIQLDGRPDRHRYQERTVEEIRAAAEGWHKRE